MERSFRTLALLVLLLIPFSPAEAQLLPIADGLSLTFSPEYPRPYDPVTVTVESSQLNLAASDIAISVNGTIIEEGLRSAQFTAGGPGSRTIVRASVTSVEGTQTAERVLRPGDVALIVEPDSTVPPFYEGASLVAGEGRVRIIAMADLRTAPGTKVTDANISYTWRMGSKILEAESGLGKSVLVATAPPRYRDADISVTATTRDQSVVAYAATSISPIDPFVRIYPSDPLRGVDFGRALSGIFSVVGTEASFHAVPYFFPVSPSFSWSLNGNTSGASDDITVRSSGASGSALLTAGAESSETSVTKSVTVQFGEATRSGLFGF